MALFSILVCNACNMQVSITIEWRTTDTSCIAARSLQAHGCSCQPDIVQSRAQCQGLLGLTAFSLNPNLSMCAGFQRHLKPMYSGAWAFATRRRSQSWRSA